MTASLVASTNRGAGKCVFYEHDLDSPNELGIFVIANRYATPCKRDSTLRTPS